MDFVRRLSALIIARNLALPQRSCIHGSVSDVHSALSNADALLSAIAIVLLSSIALIVLVFPGFSECALLFAMAATGGARLARPRCVGRYRSPVHRLARLHVRRHHRYLGCPDSIKPAFAALDIDGRYIRSLSATGMER